MLFTDWLINVLQHQPCGRYLGCQLSSVSPSSRQCDISQSDDSFTATWTLLTNGRLCLGPVVKPGLDSNAKSWVFQEPTLPWVSLLLSTTCYLVKPRANSSLSAGPLVTCYFSSLIGQICPRADIRVGDWWREACSQTEEVYTLLEVGSYKHPAITSRDRLVVVWGLGAWITRPSVRQSAGRESEGASRS